MNEICLDINLENVCRICLSETDPSVRLFHLYTGAIVDGTLVTVSAVMEYCMDLRVPNDGSVPDKICQTCRSQMFQFYVFKQKCHRTDRVLRSIRLLRTNLNESPSRDSNEVGGHSDDEATPQTVSVSCVLLHDKAPEAQVKDELIEELIGDPVSPASVEQALESPIAEESLEQTDRLYSSSPKSDSGANDEGEGEDEPESKVATKKSNQTVRLSVRQLTPTEASCIECKICGKKTLNRSRLTRHLKLHTDSSVVLEHMRFYSCTVCHSLFLSEQQLAEHQPLCTSSSAGSDEERRGGGGLCGVCNAWYDSSQHLKQHLVSHLQRFPCPFEGCGCVYVSLARLSVHVSSKHLHPDGTVCPHCHEDIGADGLKQHVRLVCKGKLFACKHCDKKFLTSRALAHHLKSLAQSFQCTQCGKLYNTQAALRLHERSHTGERPYVCAVCNKSYKTASLRTAHMESHIEGKTFECSICGKFLQTRICYRNHIRRHREERCHGCDVCEKQYYTKYSLRVHQEMVHKRKRSAQVDDY